MIKSPVLFFLYVSSFVIIKAVVYGDVAILFNLKLCYAYSFQDILIKVKNDVAIIDECLYYIEL